MELWILSAFIFFFLLLLIFMGVHVGVALGLLSMIGIWLATGSFDIGIDMVGTASFHAVREYIFGVIPLFVLMGLFANLSGLSQEMYDAFHVLLRKISGGLAMATVGANALFATITGVSIASVAVFSKVSLKPMRNLGYNKRFALGTIAGSSVLGMLIPPSLLLIIYGMLSGVSIGKLFIAGIIPGLLLVSVYCVGIYVMVKIKPELAGGRASSYPPPWTRKDTQTVMKPWGLVALMLLVLGGIYGGFFTPTEAGAVGAFGVFLLVIVKKRMTKQAFWHTLMETGYTSASVLFLLIAAQMYSRMLALTGIISTLENILNNINFKPLLIVCIMVLFLILLGTVLDSTSILLIAMPMMLPVVEAMSYDLLWFGIVSIIAVEMGLLTPPLGMVVYAMKSALHNEASVEDIFMGALPFLGMMAITLIILLIFPEIVTILPETAGG